MKLKEIISIQSIIDKRAIRSDTLEFLKKKRFSKSKDQWIEYGDMHIDHFIRVFDSQNLDESLNQEKLDFLVKKKLDQEAEKFIEDLSNLEKKPNSLINKLIDSLLKRTKTQWN